MCDEVMCLREKAVFYRDANSGFASKWRWLGLERDWGGGGGGGLTIRRGVFSRSI